MRRRLAKLVSELRRRKVIRVAAVYVVVGLAVIEGADLILEPLQLGWLYPAVVVLTLLFFPIALVLAWAFDLTPSGVERTAPSDAGSEGGPGSPSTTVVGGAPKRDPAPGTDPVELPLPRGPVLAVLPLKNVGGNPDDEFFTDGMTEDLITALARFTNLFVLGRDSTSRYRSPSVDLQALKGDLGAEYVLEGGVRRSASHLRVNLQLLDAATGTHLWAESYDRDLTADQIFAVQDEITSRVAATLADAGGVLTRTAASEVRKKPPESLGAYEAVLRAFSYWGRQTPPEHAEVRAVLEWAVERDPEYADAWACLAILYVDEHRNHFNPRPDPLDRALEAARRAVEHDPTGSLAHDALAQAHFYRRELDAFFPAAERAVRLNPNDCTTVAMMGLLTAYAGRWERGTRLLERAMALNPHHPGWYHFGFVVAHYRAREYEKALEAARRVDMPGYYPNHMWLAAIYGQLDRVEEARAATDALLEIFPDFPALAPRLIGIWLVDREAREHVLEGLRKAGLELRSDGVGVTAEVP